MCDSSGVGSQAGPGMAAGAVRAVQEGEGAGEKGAGGWRETVWRSAGISKRLVTALVGRRKGAVQWQPPAAALCRTAPPRHFKESKT